MSNTNNMASDKSEESSSGRDSIACGPIFHYHNPFSQAELRSLGTFQDGDSTTSTLVGSDIADLDNGHTPNTWSDTSNEDNASNENVQDEHVTDSIEEQSHRSGLKPKHETIEQRAERLNDEIRIQTATVQSMDRHAENWKREIAHLKALCEEHGKFKDEAMDKIARLEEKKRWVDTQLQIVDTESPYRAFGMFLSFFGRGPRTFQEVCGLVAVIAMVMFWKFWQLRA